MLLNEILGNRYQIQQQLSKKNGCQTLLALDLHKQELVIIKLLALSSDFEWDDLKFFEREAETLKTLNHPSIPSYLDYFEVNSKIKGFALVQTYIPAKTLEQYLQAGRTFTEEEVKEIALSVLEILVYLHKQNPPVIHRDIKPSNILLGGRSGHSVGIYLIDFGSVQTVTTQEVGTMTVVGTYGYMPPEQFGGRTVANSDLYSLGATLIYLITGVHPADLPQKDFHIQFEHKANLTPSFTNWLRQMTEQRLEKRFCSVDAALQALNEPQQNLIYTTAKKPFGSKIKLRKNTDSLEVLIPLSFNIIKFTSVLLLSTLVLCGLSGVLNLLLFFGINGLALFALLVWIPVSIVWLFILFDWLLFPFLMLKSLFGKCRLRIDSEVISYTHEWLGFKLKRTILARKNITKLLYTPGEFINVNEKREQAASKLEIWGERKIKIGRSITSSVEMEWLAHKLSEWLDIPISQS